MWYINKKTNELVQATIQNDGEFVAVSYDGKTACLMELADFQSQYGEAMVNNPMIPSDDKPHIKDKFCDNLGCIPYIPKQKQADEEPVFPICGTCNARKSNLSKLMLTSEQLNEVVWRYTDKENQTYALGTIIKEIAKAQIRHLAKPEFGIFKLIDGEFIRFEHYLKEGE